MDTPNIITTFLYNLRPLAFDIAFIESRAHTSVLRCIIFPANHDHRSLRGKNFHRSCALIALCSIFLHVKHIQFFYTFLGTHYQRIDTCPYTQTIVCGAYCLPSTFAERSIWHMKLQFRIITKHTHVCSGLNPG